MHCTVKPKALTPNCRDDGSLPQNHDRSLLHRLSGLRLRLPVRAGRSASLTAQSNYKLSSLSSEPSVSSHYTSSVATSSLQLSQWNFTQHHIVVLNVIACAAFKKAAESLEKLMDVTREELPETMAAVRLSDMEIGDLTMELSDLGQEITQGVRSPTRAARLAAERLRQFTDKAPSALVQEVASQKNDAGGPLVARTARGIREGIVKGRMIWQMLLPSLDFLELPVTILLIVLSRVIQTCTVVGWKFLIYAI